MVAKPAQSVPESDLNDGWETVHEESALRVLFDTIGDQFVGIYIGVDDITPDDGEPFSLFLFRGIEGETTGKVCGINQSYTLKQAMEKVNAGDITRLTYVKDIPTRRGLNPLKDFKVDVKR